MALRKLSINSNDVELYLTSKNRPIAELARCFLKDYENFLFFLADPKKVPALYLVTMLRNWCKDENNTYKVDFYECEKDSEDGKDWWLCLKRENNGRFKYDEISIEVKRCLEKAFPQTYRNFEPDNRSICLKTSSDPNEVAQLLKAFLNDLING